MLIFLCSVTTCPIPNRDLPKSWEEPSTKAWGLRSGAPLYSPGETRAGQPCSPLCHRGRLESELRGLPSALGSKSANRAQSFPARSWGPGAWGSPAQSKVCILARRGAAAPGRGLLCQAAPSPGGAAVRASFPPVVARLFPPGPVFAHQIRRGEPEPLSSGIRAGRGWRWLELSLPLPPTRRRHPVLF